MKNITVSVPDEVYRKARIHAAERDTTVSALVREMLLERIEGGAVATSELSLAERKKAFFAKIQGIRVADVPSRDEIYGSRLRKSK